jgi:MFS family permease
MISFTSTDKNIQTAVSTALPVIINDFNEEGEFVWVGSAYALAATAFLPLSGGLAQVFLLYHGSL